ncbi:MAG: copper chaperone PCu(A)C [Alphaproteobacteria bacterium]|nr:copper chaperone PCu(A)C [Alphaproteobacteria bacterium]
MNRNIVLSTLFALAALPALAHDSQIGSLKIENPWARATAATARNGAAYFTIVNPGAAPDRLLEAKASIADKVELHTHERDGDIMKMRRVDGIEVKQGETKLAPGGLHIMFLGLKGPLVEGQSFDLTLRFEKAGEGKAMIMIEKAGSMGPGAPAQAPRPAAGGHSGHKMH